jgi:triosephosphate isomerase (TIM)
LDRQQGRFAKPFEFARNAAIINPKELGARMTIKPIVAGNWKMNGVSSSLSELRNICSGFMFGLDADCDALICVPATLMSRAAEIAGSSPVRVGGQDCHAKDSGAHTGDVSSLMLKDAGASHVIVGHSERRTDHKEDDAVVNAKAQAAWRAGLVAVICIGETENERRTGVTNAVLSKQLAGSLPQGLTAQNTIIAYEPVWAIGTGLTPTAADVEDAHAHIRSELAAIAGEHSEKMRILYGGSVKPSNARELLSIANVNGALVGGASLKADDFLGICDAYRAI